MAGNIVNLYLNIDLWKKKKKISLYITYDIFQQTASRGGFCITEWNEFYYNKKDKESIFRILFQWEKDIEWFKANSLRDQQRLHLYGEQFIGDYELL